MSKSELKWAVEQERITLFPFPSIGSPTDPEAIWSKLNSTPPEEVIKKPSSASATVVGPYMNGQLRVIVTTTQRIDILLTPLIDIDLIDSDFNLPTISPMENLGNTFVNEVTKWLPESPRFFRIAYGRVLLMEVESKLEGNKELNKLLHSINLDVEHSKDLIYQINRPRISKVIRELEINRLSKWSTLEATFASLNTAFKNISSVKYANRLEIDISTDASREEEIPKELSSGLIHEMYDMGLEISKKGDV